MSGTIPDGLTVNDLVLSKSLCHGIKMWFQQNDYFNTPIKLFKTYYDYPRRDVPQTEMTAVAIYLDGPNNSKYPRYEIGEVVIEFTFNAQTQRTFQAKKFYDTLEAVRGQFMNNPVYFQQFLLDYTPGLMWIQSQNIHDTIKYRESLGRSEGSVMIPMRLKYQISILRNQRALWALGYEYYSTGTKVYYENEGININVNGQEI